MLKFAISKLFFKNLGLNKPLKIFLFEFEQLIRLRVKNIT